jgi:hypothetical protein
VLVGLGGVGEWLIHPCPPLFFQKK